MSKMWIEKNLEKPFYEAEIYKAELTKAPPGEAASMVPLYLVNLCFVFFLVFFIYSVVTFL